MAATVKEDTACSSRSWPIAEVGAIHKTSDRAAASAISNIERPIVPMDLIIQSRDEIVRRRDVKPPPEYEARLIAQMSLCCFLIIQCCIYLFIWIRDARARGKSLHIFRMERLRGGPIIIVQSLYAYVWGALMTATILLATRTVLFRIYFVEGSNENTRVWNLLALTPAVLGALVYTFSNFKAALLLARNDTGVLWSSLSPFWVWSHNFLFVGAIVAWPASIVPLAIQGNKTRRDVDTLTSETLSLLEQIISNPALLTGPNIVRLQILKSTMKSKGAYVKNRSICYLSVSVVYCAFFALSGCFTLVFVYNLRKHLQSMSSDSKNRTGDDSVELSHPTSSGFPPPFHSSLNKQAPPMTGSRRVPDEARACDLDRKSLEKLVSDLTLSVPVVLIMVLYCPIAGGIAIKFGSKASWNWREFSNDLLVWPVILLNILILGFFIFNSCRGSGRYGASSDSYVRSTVRATFETRHFPSNVWDIPQADSSGKERPAGEPLSPRVVHVTVEEVVVKEDM